MKRILYHADLGMRPCVARELVRCRPLSLSHAAYFGGLIDGEAYMGVTASRTSKSAKGCRRGVAYRLMLAIRMTDRRPLDFAVTATGVGRVLTMRIPKNGYRQPWSWIVWSAQAASVIQAVRPYLLVKAEQADVCLAFQAGMRFFGRPLTDSEWNERERFHAASRNLNYGRQKADSVP